MSDVAELMKRCQRGVGGRNALDEAHDIMAECYGTLGRLESERAALEAENARLQNALLEATARRFAESWKKRTSDADLEQYLSAGIAQLEAERDKLADELEAIKGQEPVAFYWQDIGYQDPRTHGPHFGRPSESALRNVDGRAIPVLLYTLPPASPDVEGLVKALEAAFPPLDDNGLDAELHHCEWSIQQERKRLHAAISAWRQARVKP